MTHSTHSVPTPSFTASSTARFLVAAAASVALASSAFAQQAPDVDSNANIRKDSQVTPPATQPPLPDDRVGSALGFSAGTTFTSHFVSFGADVWGGGNNASPFNSNSTIFIYGTGTAKLTKELAATVNVWSDNNNNVDSNIGGSVQEIDVNLGLNYTYENVTFGVGFSYWMFGGGAEKAIEGTIAYSDKDLWQDTLPGFAVNPSLLAHYRYDTTGDLAEASACVIQAGIAPSYTYTFESLPDYPITVAVPLNIAYFTDPYQGGDGAGFAYCNGGVSASLPLPFIDKKFGAWNVSVSEVYFHSFSDDIPNNPAQNFFVTSLSVGVSF